MGAWDSGIFDDDCAYDYFDEIGSDPKAFFKAAFKTALEAEYLEYDDCHAVTISGAYMDNLINGTTFRNDNDGEEGVNNVNNFASLYATLDVNDLKENAIAALKVVLSEKSELNELWAENEELYPQWKANIEGIIGRLK